MIQRPSYSTALVSAVGCVIVYGGRQTQTRHGKANSTSRCRFTFVWTKPPRNSLYQANHLHRLNSSGELWSVYCISVAVGEAITALWGSYYEARENICQRISLAAALYMIYCCSRGKDHDHHHRLQLHQFECLSRKHSPYVFRTFIVQFSFLSLCQNLLSRRNLGIPRTHIHVLSTIL